MPTSGLRMRKYCLNYIIIPYEKVNEVDIIHICMLIPIPYWY